MGLHAPQNGVAWIVSLLGRLVALITTRRVSEGFCGVVRPSLTLRVVKFLLAAGKSIKSTSRDGRGNELLESQNHP